MLDEAVWLGVVSQPRTEGANWLYQRPSRYKRGPAKGAEKNQMALDL